RFPTPHLLTGVAAERSTEGIKNSGWHVRHRGSLPRESQDSGQLPVRPPDSAASPEAARLPGTDQGARPFLAASSTWDDSSARQGGSCAGVWVGLAGSSTAPAQPATSSRDANSPIMMLGALVLAEGIVGMTEASATRRPSTPRTRKSTSTTASR